MYNDRSSYHHHHHHHNYHRSSPSSSPATSVISDFRNIKFSNIHSFQSSSSAAAASTYNSSTERLNSPSLNRGKDGIFRPKSIFSLATEIDFDSSNRLSKTTTTTPLRTIPSNPRLAYLRDSPSSRTSPPQYSSTSPITNNRNTDFYTNFNDNLSYLNSSSSSSSSRSSNHGTKYSANSYSKNSYILPGNYYRFTNVYHAPKFRDRPLLSNLNQKFGKSSPSTSLIRNEHRRSSGSGGSGTGSPIPPSSSSSASRKESPSGSHHNSLSLSNDQSSSGSPLSSIKQQQPTLGLERNKFLIKFREHDKPPLLNANRRSSISWDIPYDHHNQQLKKNFGSNHKITEESIKEVEDNNNDNESMMLIENCQQQETKKESIKDISSMNGTNFSNDNNFFVDEKEKQTLTTTTTNTPCLTRWKGSFNLNDDAGIGDDNNNNNDDDDDEFKNKFDDLNFIDPHHPNYEPTLLKESLLTTITNTGTGYGQIQQQNDEIHRIILSQKAYDLKPKSKRKPVKKIKDKDQTTTMVNNKETMDKAMMTKPPKRAVQRTKSLKLSKNFSTVIDIPYCDQMIEMKISANELVVDKEKEVKKKIKTKPDKLTIVDQSSIQSDGNKLKQLKKSATSQLPILSPKTPPTTDDGNSMKILVAKRKKPKQTQDENQMKNDQSVIDKNQSTEIESKKVPKIKLIPEKLDPIKPLELNDNEKTLLSPNEATAKKTSEEGESSQKRIVEKSNEELKPKTKCKDKPMSPVLLSPPKSPEIKPQHSPKLIEDPVSKIKQKSLNEKPKSPKLETNESKSIVPEESKKTKFSFNKSSVTMEKESEIQTESESIIVSPPKSPKIIQSPKSNENGSAIVKRTKSKKSEINNEKFKSDDKRLLQQQQQQKNNQITLASFIQ
nr:probable serine/threonine-protein kinase DDB_G0282963 [Dermatophagoides farinae]